MKLFNRFSVVTILSSVLLLSAIVSGCKNSAASDDEEDHFPVGAVLKMNGEEIVRYEGSSSITGSIEVPAGEETALISIYFIAEDGDEFQPDEADHSLRWTIENQDIAEVEQHSEDGKWRFHVIGKASGSTTVDFELWHGSHEDFTASGIPINVN